MTSVEIAKVDFLDFVSGDAERKEKFVQEIGDSFAEIGFVIVKNHGVSKELRDKLYEASKKFFELEDTIKDQYEIESLAGQRGYTGKKKETAKGSEIPDLKEFYHIGQNIQGENTEGYPENIWPSEVAEFKTYGEEVYKTFEDTGRNLLKAIALYLGLYESYFDSKIENGNSILRLLHYFPIENTDEIEDGAIRAAAHEDINLITLLMGGSAEGLQAQAKDGTWVDVNPEPDEIVINIGDMLQRLTNNRLRSTTHRVINPRKELLHTSRYSTPFFLHPKSEMDLTCLKSCISESNPKRYDDTTAGNYLMERLKELGLLK
ncbi:isopenicillin N synthase family dioxygenase [Sediminitomix flava]|uniref:2-oxoglutarate-dependent ethylene/succinate-forming enzyme n=1 Tax=Sediminitomix flava TaxID=379075 RepID=A0A315Z8Q0_SEDFL|nr:2-oxoglutarate and iron-dependent oxygenase domain-containing protein [Sediminitomix flava]PWJ40070.1 isopenicillin N synthase-like dioxygenase [Sediminitomix flava]